MDYEDAVAELHKAPHGEFVNERKRLAGELKAEGDKAGATRLGKLPRPPISAWTVNQLWWQAREEFDALFESAEKLRNGDLGANAEHRDALAKLRQRASTILTEAGHGSTETTLRRVATTLSALAATGSFDPDPEGALSADRDPPGFEVAGLAAMAASTPAKKTESKPKTKADDDDKDDSDDDDDKAEATAKALRELTEAAAERKKKEETNKKRLSAVRSAESNVSGAKSELERKQKDLDRLRKAVEAAEAAVEKSQTALDEAEAELAKLTEAEEEE